MCWGVAHAGNHARILNVNADLGYFDNIIPCGIRGKAVTFITSRGLELKKVNEEEVKAIEHFISCLNVNSKTQHFDSRVRKIESNNRYIG
jgi:lipoate-protein ligase B